MRKLLPCSLIVGATILLLVMSHQRSRTEAAEESDHLLAHNVYFSLKDHSPEARKKMVQACKKYLSGHPGEVFFAAGILAEDLSRDVNDRDFDVALHIVFKNKEAHDQYQDAQRHKQLIEENKECWKKVRVFDSVVSK